MLTWHYATMEEYIALPDSSKSYNSLFFIKGTNTIFQGKEVFNESIVPYASDYPSSHVDGKMYINSNTLEGYVWAGRWVRTIRPAISISSIYEDSRLVDMVEYDSSRNNLIVKYIDGTIDHVDFDNFIIDLMYSTGSKEFNLKFENCKMTENKKNIRIKDFISSISFNNTIINISFKKSTSVLSFDIGNIIQSGNNILHITGNRFMDECLRNSDIYNGSTYDSGLYIVGEMKADQKTRSATNSLSIVNNVVRSMRNTLLSSLDNKMVKVGSGYTDEVLIADDLGNATPSGVKISNVISEVPSDDIILTEKSLYDFTNKNVITKDNISKSDAIPEGAETASDTTAISEKSALTILDLKVIH